MSVVGGVVFGWWGLPLSLLGSLLGALPPFLVTRRVLRLWLLRRIGGARAQAADRAVRENGALFVALAFGMFGAFELQMPSSIQTRLSAISGDQKSGTMVGAFIMGGLSALIVTACVAPVLIAALMVIAQTGDVMRGALALFAMATRGVRAVFVMTALRHEKSDADNF